MSLNKIIRNFDKQIKALDKYIDVEKYRETTGHLLIEEGGERVKEAKENISRASRIKQKIEEIVQ